MPIFHSEKKSKYVSIVLFDGFCMLYIFTHDNNINLVYVCFNKTCHTLEKAGPSEVETELGTHMIKISELRQILEAIGV